MKERMIPNNIDAELCLLGSIMLDNEALEQVRDYLRAPRAKALTLIHKYESLRKILSMM